VREHAIYQMSNNLFVRALNSINISNEVSNLLNGNLNNRKLKRDMVHIHRHAYMYPRRLTRGKKIKTCFGGGKKERTPGGG